MLSCTFFPLKSGMPSSQSVGAIYLVYSKPASFVTKAIPTGGTEEETFVLPYAHCWNELAYISNNHLLWKINPYIAEALTWGHLELPVPKGSFFDVSEGWAIRIE